MSHQPRHRLLLAAGAVLASGAIARGDAIMTSRAMRASTIAEYFVEEASLAVEMEIGAGDLDAFVNLLPDELFEEGAAAPHAERLATFFGEDLTVRIGDAAPLPGRIVEMIPRERVVRDAITGEPLAADAPAEPVLFVRLAYDLPPRPASLTIGGNVTSATGIGYVLYHRSIAVNDFRYLTASQTVNLDWTDPWYSSFTMRSLRRTYFAPMSGFLYVEPYEVRKEIIARPKDLQHWVDLGLAGRDTIPAAMQAELKRTVAAFLREHQPVRIDGAVIEPELAQINFLERTLRSSRVVDPPRDLDVDGAILGIIFVYPTTQLPQRVTMDWDLFNDRITAVPASSVDQAGPLPTTLEPDYATLEWVNYLKNPVLPTTVALAAPPGGLARIARAVRWPLVGLFLVAGGVAAGARRGGGRAPLRAASALVAAGLAGAAFWIGSAAGVSSERAGPVVAGLLHNVYRAFDYRDEERIYDVLEQSVQGDLLTRIYLETRAGLELANQGGARAKVKEVDVVELVAEPGDAGGFIATVSWHVTGSVGHWGHIHQRKNGYRARLDVRPAQGAWRLTGLEILEEARLSDAPGAGPTG